MNMARKLKEDLLFKKSHILPIIETKVGNIPSQNIIDDVIAFYNNDDNTRICSDIKNCIKYKGLT